METSEKTSLIHSVSMQWDRKRWQTIEFGSSGTLQYRMMFYDRLKEQEVSPIHSIPLYIGDGHLNFICKTSRGTWTRLEASQDEPFNPLRLAQQKGRPAHHVEDLRWNFGMLPKTYADPEFSTSDYGDYPYDGCPIEVFDVGSRTAKAGEVYPIKPLAAFALIANNSRMAWKVIGIAADDDYANKLNDVVDLNSLFPGTLEEIREWLRSCYTSDGVLVIGNDDRVVDMKTVIRIVAETHASWQLIADTQESSPFSLGKPLKPENYESMWQRYTKSQSTATIPMHDPESKFQNHSNEASAFLNNSSELEYSEGSSVDGSNPPSPIGLEMALWNRCKRDCSNLADCKIHKFSKPAYSPDGFIKTDPSSTAKVEDLLGQSKHKGHGKKFHFFKRKPSFKSLSKSTHVNKTSYVAPNASEDKRENMSAFHPTPYFLSSQVNKDPPQQGPPHGLTVSVDVETAEKLSVQVNHDNKESKAHNHSKLPRSPRLHNSPGPSFLQSASTLELIKSVESLDSSGSFSFPDADEEGTLSAPEKEKESTVYYNPDSSGDELELDEIKRRRPSKARPLEPLGKGGTGGTAAEEPIREADAPSSTVESLREDAGNCVTPNGKIDEKGVSGAYEEDSPQLLRETDDEKGSELEEESGNVQVLYEGNRVKQTLKTSPLSSNSKNLFNNRVRRPKRTMSKSSNKRGESESKSSNIYRSSSVGTLTAVELANEIDRLTAIEASRTVKSQLTSCMSKKKSAYQSDPEAASESKSDTSRTADGEKSHGSFTSEDSNDSEGNSCEISSSRRNESISRTMSNPDTLLYSERYMNDQARPTKTKGRRKKVLFDDRVLVKVFDADADWRVPYRDRRAPAKPTRSGALIAPALFQEDQPGIRALEDVYNTRRKSIDGDKVAKVPLNQNPGPAVANANGFYGEEDDDDDVEVCTPIELDCYGDYTI